MELDVLDVQPAVQPLLLVVGPDAENLVSHTGMIEVFRHHIYRKMILLNHVAGIGEHKVAVCLQMDDTVRYQELAITLHEIGGGQTLGCFLHLRVGEGQPYLAHFVLCKETVDDFNVRTQESDILHASTQGFRSTGPHTGTLDVYTNKVLIGKQASQSDRVFTTSAS